MSGVKRFLFKGLNIILRVAEVFFLITTIYGFYQASGESSPGNKMAGIVVGVIFLMGLLVCIGIEILKVGYKNKCPSCGKWFALKREKGREFIGKEKVSVAVTTRSDEYHRDGTKTGRYSEGYQYVPGHKYTYHINYTCRKCGKSCYSTVTERHADI